jgi:hypothetical protein
MTTGDYLILKIEQRAAMLFIKMHNEGLFNFEDGTAGRHVIYKDANRGTI